MLLLDEPSAGLDPRQRERALGVRLELAGAGTTVIFSTHHIAEAERYGERLLVLADGELRLRRHARRAPRRRARRSGGRATSRQAFVAFLRERGH